MRPDLARVLERLDWADKNFYRLDQDMRALVAGLQDGKTHNIFQNREPDTGYSVYRLVVRIPIPATEWALRISEIAHHARAALDNLIYAMTVKHTKSPSDELLRVASFPFSKSDVLFKQRDKSGMPAWGSGIKKIEGIDPKAWTVVESLQPYPGRTGLPVVLHHLDQFWNADKHRLPPVTIFGARMQSVSVTGDAFTGTSEIGGTALIVRPEFPFEDGAEVARYKPLADDMQMVMKGQISFRVRFAQGTEPWSGRDIGAFLQPCLHGVRQAALLFEPFF